MDAIDLLTRDHERLDGLLDRFAVQADREERTEALRSVVRELSIHLAIEDRILYRAVRDAFPDGEELADDLLERHKDLEQALAAYQELEPSEEDGRVRKLREGARRHISDEEREVFPKVREHVPQDRLEKLGDELERARADAATRPHPRTSREVLASRAVGPVAGMVDRVRDATREAMEDRGE